MVVAGSRRIGPAHREVHVREERLGEWDEGSPAQRTRQRQGTFEDDSGGRKFLAQQMTATDKCEGPCFQASLVDLSRQPHRVIQLSNCLGVAADIGQGNALHRPGPRSFGPIIAGQHGGLVQPAPRSVVAASERLDVAQLAMRVRSARISIGSRGGNGLVEDPGAFAITAADAVDQRGSERRQGMRLENDLTRLVRFGDGLPQGRDAGIDGTGIECGDACLEADGDARSAGRGARPCSDSWSIGSEEDALAGVSAELTPE